MGRIRTYEQQVGITAPTGRSSISSQTAGLVGQAYSNLGQSLVGLGEQLHKNDIQKDISGSHQSLSKLRNDFTRRIQEETQKGTINAEALQQEYQEALGELSGSVTTKEGKDYLEQHGADLGNDIIRTASLHQANVAGKLAVEQWQNSINLNGNTLQTSPASFDDVLRDSIATLEEQVQNGTLDRVDAEKLKRLSGEQYAQAAVRGWANINADTAKTMLDQGVFDKYTDKKAELYGMIKTYKAAEETEKERVKKLKEEAQAKASEAWEQDHLDDLEQNTLSTKDILESPLKANRKIQYLNMMKAHLKEKLQTDPAVKNELIKRMLLSPEDPRLIKDRTQLYNYVGNGITTSDLKQLTTFLDATPEGQRMKNNRKLLLDQADASLVKRDPITGQPDPQGPYNLSLFTNALLDAEQEMIKAKKDPAELYNPNSKEYFGHQIFKYKATPQEIFQRQFNFQGLQIPDGVQEKRKDNESAEEYLKRQGL